MPSTSGLIVSGFLFRIREALSRVWKSEILWNKNLVCSAWSDPELRARAAPSFLTCWTVVSCIPPRDSVGIGMNSIPSALQAAPTSLYFLVKACSIASVSVVERVVCGKSDGQALPTQIGIKFLVHLSAYVDTNYLK